MWEPELYATASATWLIEIRCFLTVHMCTLSHTNMCRVLSQHGAHLHVAADGQAPAGLQNATSAHPRVVSRHMLGELRLLVASRDTSTAICSKSCMLLHQDMQMECLDLCEAFSGKGVTSLPFYTCCKSHVKHIRSA